MKSTALGLAALIAASLPHACLANDLPATEQFSGTTVEFKLDKLFGVVTLTVAGPNGFNASASARSTSPAIDLRRVGPFDDGTYHYQLTASTDEKVPVRTTLDNGRSGGPTDAKLKDVSRSGQFLVKGGTIVKPSTAQPARLDKDAR
ncbi:MAG: hypothetical protein WCE79_05025 [Xanthobacteraceae bacterium]